jgi:hypothetical protein
LTAIEFTLSEADVLDLLKMAGGIFDGAPRVAVITVKGILWGSPLATAL